MIEKQENAYPFTDSSSLTSVVAAERHFQKLLRPWRLARTPARIIKTSLDEIPTMDEMASSQRPHTSEMAKHLT